MIKDLLALAPRGRATNLGADSLPAVAVLQNFHPQEHLMQLMPFISQDTPWDLQANTHTSHIQEQKHQVRLFLQSFFGKRQAEKH